MVTLFGPACQVAMTRITESCNVIGQLLVHVLQAATEDAHLVLGEVFHN